MIAKILHFIERAKTVSFIALMVLFSSCTVCKAQLNPAIEIQPGNRVEVGEEVFLSATKTTYPDATLLGKSRYEWDFGDGYYHRFVEPIVKTTTRSGIAVTHYYMKPGDFTVTLTVTLWADWGSGGAKPIGSPLATNTTTRVVHVTGEAPMAGFEIQRAPFHNRLAQYLYVQIPAAYRGNQTTLRVTLEGAKGSSSTLLSKSNPTGEERVFLDHKPLAQGDYVLIAELLDASGQRIPGGIWRDKFSKLYSGIPKVGIDENNAFRVNGELFFPIGSFLTDNARIKDFVDKAGINTLNTEGYNTTHTPTTWSKYIDNADSYNLMTIGPGQGDYRTNYRAGGGRFNYNVDRMAEYVRVNKDKPMMFAWIWQDEPNLGGRTEKVYPPTLAAWAYVSHREDHQHLAYNLYLGNDWSKYYGRAPNGYDYLGSASFFGGKKWSQDVFSFDLYPVQSRLHPSFNFVDMGPYAVYLDALDRARTSNKDLLPVMPALQPCRGATINSWDSVTEEQVYFEAWVNVIHGAKGIVWFPYFAMANTGRWTAMKKFSDQMKVLTPIVLQPESARTVADNANVALNRVDTTIREKDNAVYIFTARVTEMDPIPAAKYQGVEPDSITVNFTVSGLVRNVTAEVVDEGRKVSLINGQFTDRFVKNAVHIYKITIAPSPPLRDPLSKSTLGG
jgi:hypothetical protein